MGESRWYHAGLRFQCSECGDCCTGSPGHVLVNSDEIEKLATHVGETVAVFETKYVRQVGARKSLIEYSNGDCVFFDGLTRKCTLYEARPLQCRTWPFWESNVSSPQAWKRTCEVCPGSGQGTLFPADKILHQISVVKL